MKVATKVKKSYSISIESEQLVRRVRESRHIASDSEALDQILREFMLAQHRSSIDADYKAYYDAASNQDLSEETTWASFAEVEMTELTK